MEEKSGGKFRVLKAENIVVLIRTFEEQHDGVLPKSRTLLLVHLKGIGLRCNIFIRSIP